jgi:gamma-glutamyl:cysteine ligase YbdK (ATP-grasp superfamily)
MNFEDLTIGIEEEYQIIDPESRELTSFISEILNKGAVLFRDQVKPEFLQSQVETGSHVCRNIKEARQEVTRLRGMVCDIALKNNRKIVAAGTHPFSRWEDQIVTDRDRYKGLEEDFQMVAHAYIWHARARGNSGSGSSHRYYETNDLLCAPYYDPVNLLSILAWAKYRAKILS